MSNSDVEAVRRVVQAFNDRDTAAVVAAVTPDFARHDLAGAFIARSRGGDEAEQFIQGLYRALPDIRIEIDDIFAAEGRVTARYHFTGRHEGDLLGVAPTGRQVSFNAINIYRMEDGKVAEAWQLWDWASVLAQLGVLPTRGAP